MYKIMEDLLEDQKIEMAKRAIQDGTLPLASISKIFGLPLDEVKNLAKSVTV